MFIFTAGNPSAQQHLRKSITNAISPELIFPYVNKSTKPTLKTLEEREGGLYAGGQFRVLGTPQIGVGWK